MENSTLLKPEILSKIDERKREHTKRCSEIFNAVTNAINALDEINKSIGNITPNDDYMFLELRYMTTNYKLNLNGFIKARLVNEEYLGRIQFDIEEHVYKPYKNSES